MINLPGYVAGIRDEVINQIGLSILSEVTNETAAGRMYVETASLTLAAQLSPSQVSALSRVCVGARPPRRRVVLKDATHGG
jgi:hypothetical protein